MTSSKILESYLQRKKASQPGYSLRAFARDLGVSPAFISLVLSGKKRLPIRLVSRAVEILDIDMETAQEIKFSYVPAEVATPTKALRSALFFAIDENPRSKWILQPRQKLKALRHWFYVAILDLTTVLDYDGTAEFLARRLGLAVPTVEIALRELKALGLLIERGGKLVKAERDIRLASHDSQADIRRFHTQMLEKAKAEMNEKISREDFTRRLVTGITFAADPERIEAAKKMLSDCLHEIASLLSTGNGREVYHLSAQLFPLTQTEFVKSTKASGGQSRAARPREH